MKTFSKIKETIIAKFISLFCKTIPPQSINWALKIIPTTPIVNKMSWVIVGDDVRYCHLEKQDFSIKDFPYMAKGEWWFCWERGDFIEENDGLMFATKAEAISKLTTIIEEVVSELTTDISYYNNLYNHIKSYDIETEQSVLSTFWDKRI